MTQTYLVYYANDMRSVTGEPPKGALALMTGYRLVGAVEADDLEDLFRRMNVVDGSSFEMPSKLHCRSMSVGDVAVGEDNVAWFCASAGWLEVRVEDA